MTITIDLRRIKDFALKHKEAVVVAGIAALVIRRQHNNLMYVLNESCSCVDA